ncbi:hypothetical protein [Nocardia sp. NPDC059239]|uniref:hypothetical protein n=2 Tax=unclassified Nocardia TaxID=2637762 RepID=UPI00367CEF6D
MRAARGIPAFVPLAEPASHLDTLYNWGFSDHAIAAAAGMDQKSVWKIRHRVHDKVSIECAARIMAVTHVPVPAQSGMKVPNIGTKRRIQALLAIGWKLDDLGQLAGVSGRQFSQYNTRTWVQYETWAKVRELYEELSGTPGSSRYGETRARNSGYLPPLAWEGHDIDHPQQSPIWMPATPDDELDEVLLDRIIHGKHSGKVHEPERTALLDYAIANGWTGTRVAEALNLKQDAGEQALVRRKAKLRKNAA